MSHPHSGHPSLLTEQTKLQVLLNLAENTSLKLASLTSDFKAHNTIQGETIEQKPCQTDKQSNIFGGTNFSRKFKYAFLMKLYNHIVRAIAGGKWNPSNLLTQFNDIKIKSIKQSTFGTSGTWTLYERALQIKLENNELSMGFLKASLKQLAKKQQSLLKTKQKAFAITKNIDIDHGYPTALDDINDKDYWISVEIKLVNSIRENSLVDPDIASYQNNEELAKIHNPDNPSNGLHLTEFLHKETLTLLKLYENIIARSIVLEDAKF